MRLCTSWPESPRDKMMVQKQECPAVEDGVTDDVDVRAIRTSGSRNEFLVRPFVFPSALTPLQCDQLLELGRNYPLQPGRLVDDVPDYRICRLAELPRDADCEWAFQRIFELFRVINAAWYQFDTTDLIESIQLIRYDVGGQIKWHSDCGPGAASTRKLALTIQLSDKSTYTGGALEFIPDGEQSGCRGQGTAIVFPAFLAHRVAAVTEGTRFSLVTWLHGPAFK